MPRRRFLGFAVVVLIIVGLLYLPVRRELLDGGVIAAATFRSPTGETLTFYDNGTYVSRKSKGTYKTEHFVEAPWISLLRLDTGRTLHVSYEARVYRVEDIPELAAADAKYVRQ